MKRSPVLKTLAWFAAAYALAIVGDVFHFGELFDRAFVALRGDNAMETTISLQSLGYFISRQIAGSYFGALFVASIAVPLGALVRMVARARVRAGFRDPLDKMRQFTSRSGARWALAATPALWWLAVSVRMLTHSFVRFEMLAPVMALPIFASFASHLFLSSHGLRALLAPTTDGEAQEATADGCSFDAVAVTKET